MNRNSSKVGWAAVCVDGFIPPKAFMEFQAHRVLVIAADIRQLIILNIHLLLIFYMKQQGMHQLFPMKHIQNIYSFLVILVKGIFIFY